MTIEITRFDAMEALDTTEDHIALVNDALATGDPQVLVHAIREIARARNMSELARASGIGRSSLYKALAEDGNPTIGTLLKLLGALDIELQGRRRIAA